MHAQSTDSAADRATNGDNSADLSSQAAFSLDTRPSSDDPTRLADSSRTDTDSSFQSPSDRATDSAAASRPKSADSESEQSGEDIHARIERKRIEHEQQRAMQRKVFEQQMMLLEMQQREEERNLLQQQQRPSSASRDPRNLTQTLSNVAVSAPSTPPKTPSDQFAGRKPSEARPHGPTLLGSVPSNTEPEEGLNGSNVPGLPLAPGASTFRSVPTSRRQSQDGKPNSNSPSQARLPNFAGRARVNNPSDLAGAFDKMGLAPRGSSQLRSSMQDSNSGSGNGEAASRQRAKGGNPADGPTQPGGGFTPVFNERFLFDDELDAEDSAFVKRYNLQEDDDKFPILVRRDSFPDVLSASSAALDLAPLSQTAKESRGDSKSPKLSEWPQFGANAGGDHSRDDTSSQRPKVDQDLYTGRNGKTERNSPSANTSLNGEATRTSSAFPLPSPSPRISQTAGRASPAVASGLANSTRHTAPVSPTPTTPSHLDQVQRSGGGSRFAAHMGPADLDMRSQGGRGLPHGESGLKPIGVAGQHGSASVRDNSFPSFSLGAFSSNSGSDSPNRFGPYSPGPFDSSDSARGSRPTSGFFDAFNPAANVFGNDKFGVGLGGADAHVKMGMGVPPIKHARKGELDAGTRLEDLQGEIFALCKDQHGCRYLQKKLEEGQPSHRDMIFAETFNHFAELMTDPFGNYLCQKMLEYCTDEQRNLIVESVAPELVTISLNMHGTRAVQKTIDFLSTSRQIHSIIVALSMNVVTLIKDLNGNHVIQKCLNRLGAEDNQFIYNAVAAHCVEVATHRHGCCVLQRCIDHASDSQRIQLVAEITYNALTLVQDPFGNYVVQYVLDLSDPRFTDAVIRQFVGNVCLLSVQKFSSNVIEKCIRVSDPSIRKQLIEELLNRSRLEKLLRDSFANYVVQTSLDYADPVQRMRLVECIRPILPMIRNTPYGKRIQSKLQRDNLDLGPPSGVPFSLLQAAHHQQLQAMAAIANRQGPDYMGMNAYAHVAMHQQPPHHPHHHPHHQGPPTGQQQSQSGGGNPNQHVPPQLQHLYGGNPSPMPQHAPQQGGPNGPHHLGGGGGSMNAGHGLPPLNYGPHAYGGNSFNGAVPPPMSMHGGPSGFPSNVNGGFGGPY